ncbi:hypothetical protein DK37_05680 [Halomonas sp. SUBG004]|nr:hypothetical protein DK37_05680 [Halomonas sp. SUBG004]
MACPHPDFGEGVTAVVVPQPGEQVDEAAILDHLAGRLAKYKTAKSGVFFFRRLAAAQHHG